jgi:hypothetical protein
LTKGPLAQPVAVAWFEPDGSALFASLQCIDKHVWLIRGALAINTDTGLVETVQLTVESWDGHHELTVDVLRRLKLASIREQAHLDLLSQYGIARDEELLVVYDPESRVSVAQRGSRIDVSGRERHVVEHFTAKTDKRRGRPPKPDSFYQRVAEVAIQVARDGIKPHHLEVGRRLGTTPGKARDWIHEARKRDFLAHTKMGRRGAAPGRRLFEAIHDDLHPGAADEV